MCFTNFCELLSNINFSLKKIVTGYPLSFLACSYARMEYLGVHLAEVSFLYESCELLFCLFLISISSAFKVGTVNLLDNIRLLKLNQ